MMSKMDEVFKRVLNDKDIFDSPYDRNKGKTIPKLFDEKYWEELRKLFKARNKDKFSQMVENRISELEKQDHNASTWRRQKISELKQYAEWLKRAFDEKPCLLEDLFETLSWYGLVECKLPTMDDYGKVIERYELSIVLQFFSDKIGRAKFPQNRALKKILEYVKELFSLGFSPEEIAYFIRKVDSLEKYWEIIE